MTMISLAQIRRDLSLFIKTPREFLYSFTYPNHDFVTIEPYDPRITEMGRSIMSSIQKRFPSLKVHFYGSAALKIAGQRDIDLIAECTPAEFDTYLPGLQEILGEPQKRRSTFIEWHIDRENCSIEFMLIDPSSPIFKGPIKVFEKIKSNPQLIKIYERLKLASNGVSVREYKRRRLVFFNQVEKS